MMRAVLEDMKSGEVSMYEVPAPEIQPGAILVRTAFSAISAGTEKVKIESGQKSLFGKAMARPDLVKQVLEYAQTNGVKAAYQKVQSRLDALSQMGYSCSGYVLEAGESVTEFKPGDRVACAGGGYANHCEINSVPCNLAVRIPDNVDLEAAALTTIGAIAMQGVRQANVTVGETVAVIGAGLVGVLTIQILRASGCRVIAIDLSGERAAKAVSLGAHLGLSSSDHGLDSAVISFSRYGVDAALITAATRSAEPVELAARILRDRGRLVIVGDVGMGVSRGNMYMKEISLSMSRSYGPGRYDPRYEEGGQDYPVGYVRWTERRNMEAFLDLLSTGAIGVQPLLAHRYPVEDGGKAYADLKSGIYTGIIDYHALSDGRPAAKTASAERTVVVRPIGKVRIGCLGAGGFARGVIFPNLRSCSEVVFESVATGSGVAAESARKGFGFATAETPSELLANANVDAAFIITRHKSHAAYVEVALRQGKAVFVEKPLAVDREQLDLVKAAYASQLKKQRQPFLMVGFNRRFAPLTAKLLKFLKNYSEPMLVHIRCNAGFIPRTSWIQSDGEGGRIVGEFCHFVDWARAVVRSPIEAVTAAALPDCGRYNRDNVSATLTFRNGSVANILYLANGNHTVPKEYFEVFCAGSIARLDDFKTLCLSRGGKTEKCKSAQDKGHRHEIELTVKAMMQGTSAPIPFEELAEVTEATFAVDEAIRTRRTVFLSGEGESSLEPAKLRAPQLI
jgi:predicted dehydrogenase/threonine dehydrogenase-like Zn-dependent dehydrogenase